MRRLRIDPVDATAAALIGLLLYTVYFSGVAGLGLYEDDFKEVAGSFAWSWSQVLDQAGSWLVEWPRGRPLSRASGLVLYHGLFEIGGLGALYLVPFAAVWLNSVLLYRISLPITGRFGAFVCGLGFALLPTDTLRLSLHHTVHLQFAITCLLIAMLLYRSGRRIGCYVVAALGMLFHESAATAYLAIPLLVDVGGSWRDRLRQLIRFGVGWTVAIGAVIAVRITLMSDGRAVEAVGGALWTLQRMLTAVRVGTLTHLQLIPYDSYQSFRALTGFDVELGGDFAWILVAVLAWLWFTMMRRADRPSDAARVEPAAVGRLALVAAACFALPYLMYFRDPYWPAAHVAGRMASVHSVSGAGVALGLGVAAAIVVRLPGGWLVRGLPVAVFTLCFSLLGAFSHVVERQYAEAWFNQRQFWPSFVRQLGDVGDRTLIFLEIDDEYDLPYTWMIGSHSWADSIMLALLYDMSGMEREPRVFYLDESWRGGVRHEDGALKWTMPRGAWWSAREVELEQGNVVLFEARDGDVRRVSGTIELGGGELRLLDLERPGEPDRPRGPLHRLLIGGKRR